MRNIISYSDVGLSALAGADTDFAPALPTDRRSDSLPVLRSCFAAKAEAAFCSGGESIRRAGLGAAAALLSEERAGDSSGASSTGSSSDELRMAIAAPVTTVDPL